MATKTSKKTSEKSALKSKTSISSQKTKKVVVKRRTSDLSPTKASAVAIASQANRAKKQALIQKVSLSENHNKTSSSKIPLWVWLFFWWSLLLFCISFYQAIIRPQLVTDVNINRSDDSVYWIWWSTDEENIVVGEWTEDLNNNWVGVEDGLISEGKTGVIARFFDLISDRDFDGSFDLFSSALKNTQDIRTHFTEYRLSPFLSGIQWWRLQPKDIEYISTSEYGNDKYGFNLSYTLLENQEQYDEMWEIVIDDKWDEPRIASIVCVTSRCSYHPIFWPENFGLMK